MPYYQDSGTVPLGSISLAEIQDISTDKLLGRVTAGTGDVEQVTFTDFGQSLMDDANAAAGRATLSAAVLGANGDITSLTATTAVTFNGDQDYLLSTNAGTNDLYFQSQNSGSGFEMMLFTKDGDSTDDIGYAIWGVGLPTSLTNRERIIIRWDSVLSEYVIRTEANGTGTLRPLSLYTGANTDQLKLLTDGNITAAGNITATGTLGGSNVSGTNTGDQTITLTGDVTGSGTGSFAATIADSNLQTLKTAFTSASASGPASLALHEDTDNGTSKVTIIAPAALAGDVTLTLQDATGTVISTNGSTIVPAGIGGTGVASFAGPYRVLIAPLLAGDPISVVASAGNSGEVLTSNGGLAAPTYQALPAAGISNVVEDTTPQLGGTLDCNTFSIQFDDNTGIFDENNNELVLFRRFASATNFITIANATTGNPASITAGGDANTNIHIKAPGTGVVRVDKEHQVVAFDYAVNTAVGNGAAYIHVGRLISGMDLVYCHARVITAGTTNTTDIQIANVTAAVDMLSTKLTVDSGETGSETAATPYVIDTSSDGVTENDVLRIDVDAISTTPAKGLIVTLGFKLP